MSKLRNSIILFLILIFISGNIMTVQATEEWKFFIEAKDSYNSTDTLKNITLAQTCDETTLIDNKVAPRYKWKF